MKSKSIWNMWQNFKISVKQKMIGQLEKSYKKDEAKKKHQIVGALTFLKFLFEKLPWNNDNSNSTAKWSERRSQLADFVDNANPLIRVIAMIESLPTKVWRRILWKYNIDFMSFESFLRRIDEVQIRSIELNYNDLKQGKIPRVFSWWDRWFSSIEKIFSEEYNEDVRYCNKGAVSYKFFGLDFGFNAYPKGITDDTKVVEVNPWIFFSKKSHVNDFSVNREFGLYWWMYRVAHWDYTFKETEDIELKSHVCPGFWWTLGFHCVLWIISPLSIVSMAMFHIALPWNILVGICSFVLPQWIVLVLARRGFDLKAFAAVKRFIKKVQDGVLFGFVLDLVMVIFCLSIIVFASYCVLASLNELLGAVWGSLIGITLFLYFWYKAFTKAKNGYCFKLNKYPYFLQMIIKGVPILFGVHLLIVFRQRIWEVIFRIVEWIYNCAIIIGPIIYLLIFSFIFFGIVWCIARLKEEKREMIYALVEKKCIVIAGIMVVGSVILISQSGLSIDFVFAFSFLFFAPLIAAWVIMWKINPKTIAVRSDIECFKYSYFSIQEGLFLQNKWLQRQSIDERRAIVRELESLVADNFYRGSRLGNTIFRLLLPKITSEIMNIIKQNLELFRSSDVFYNDDILVEVLFEISKGASYKSAVQIATARYEKERAEAARWREFWRITWKVFKIIFFPVIFLSGLVYWSLCRLAEFFGALKFFYKLFNERCPYIIPKSTLTLGKKEEKGE